MSKIKAKILESNNGAVGFDGNGVLWQTKNLATADLTVGGTGWQALDANGGAGNYEEILPAGFYTSGTYSYPNGRTEADYSIIKLAEGNSAGVTRVASFMAEETIALPWAIVRCMADSGLYSTLSRVSGTSFTVGVVGVSGVTQLIGYLKEGVI